MKILVKTIVVVLAVAVPVRTDTTRVRAEEELRKSLLREYNKEALPQEYNNITFGSFRIQHLDMYEENHRLDVHVWLSLEWTDPRLKWDESKHQGIKHLGMDPTTIWVPDFTVYNGGDPDRTLVTANPQYHILVYPSGRILYVPSLLLHFTCIMDATYWPHDEHDCSLKIGSWVYDAGILDMTVSGDAMDEIQHKVGASGLNISTTEWKIVSTSAVREIKSYDCCEELYTDVLVSIYVRRNAPAYTWLVKTPAICLTLLTLVVFLLPVTLPGPKVTLGGMLLLCHFLFLSFAKVNVAHNPSHAPLIVKLGVVEMVLTTVSVLLSGVLAWLSHSPHSDPLPDSLKRPVVSLAHLLCLQSYARQATSLGRTGVSGSPLKNDEVELGNDAAGGSAQWDAGVGKGSSSQWLLMAAVIDRLAFLSCLAATIIILISFSSVL